MKKLILFGIIILMVIPGAFAQFRIDLAIDVPVKIGVSVSDLEGDSSNESVDVLDFGTFPVPEALFAYQTSLGPVKVGGGIRVFSLILESIAWPHIFSELSLDPVPIGINAGIGGGGFMMFGLFNDVNTANLFIPDMHIAYKFGDTFRLGIGAMGFTGSELNIDGFPYIIYLTGRVC
ncbi:MAG: hypothetical protein U9N32_04745, partial [Spirochaetota bacterium]|nr:hypothetical protein [Spirochaetota bacterium]